MTARGIVVAAALALSSACAVFQAIDEALDTWSRYSIPGSKVSVSLPGAPKFVPEPLKGSPCGDLVRVSFAVKGRSWRYSGHYVATPPPCRDPSHLEGLRFIVAPHPESIWQQESNRALPGAAQNTREADYRKPGTPGSFLIVRTLVIEEGVLGVVAEGDDTALNRKQAEKFLRRVRTE